MKKSSSLWRKCVSLCAKVVKFRDGGICRVPGCNNPATDTVHIIDRDVHITTFDLSNLYAGCRKHHNHDKPLDLIKQHIQVVGQGEVLRLCKLAQEYRRLRESDLIVIRDNLERELKRLKFGT